MFDFILKKYESLSKSDAGFLSDIFSPTAVAVPDADPGFGKLTVTRDGAIRLYGEYGKRDVYTPGKRCYIESVDCGLSWKRYLADDENVLGASKYVPFLDKYLAFREESGKNTVALLGNSPDDPNPEKYDVGSSSLEISDVLPLKSRNRIIIATHERRPERHPTAFFTVLLITDDGKNYKRIPLPEAPFAEKKWPDKGYRWQQNNREGTLCELPDGKLLLVTRTSTDFHYYAVSSDGGESWSDFAPSRFHSTGTMPKLLSLSDGRIMFFWCNSGLLPEFEDADGVWEDYFTNRDVNHAAISEDGGKTFIGYREMTVNPLARNADFRSVGGPECDRDKSVHQFEAVELPTGKILVAYGQHKVCRKVIVFDIRWLYEKQRKEDFIHGLSSVSTQLYVKSIPGGYRASSPENALEYVGHCAFNRVSGALLLPSPENDGHEALFITRKDEPYLVSGVGGAVWNFPASRKGKITLRAYLPGKGLRVSLLDRWLNPSDPAIDFRADASFVLTRNMQGLDPLFTEFIITFDCEKDIFRIYGGENFNYTGKMNGKHPDGLCYLHLQSAAAENDPDGSYISGFSFLSED